jgi:hypothetical protein
VPSYQPFHWTKFNVTRTRQTCRVSEGENKEADRRADSPFIYAPARFSFLEHSNNMFAIASSSMVARPTVRVTAPKRTVKARYAAPFLLTHVAGTLYPSESSGPWFAVALRCAAYDVRRGARIHLTSRTKCGITSDQRACLRFVHRLTASLPTLSDKTPGRRTGTRMRAAVSRTSPRRRSAPPRTRRRTTRRRRAALRGPRRWPTRPPRRPPPRSKSCEVAPHY